MANEPEPKSTAELLADWRAAGRDTVAARAAAKIAGLALEAAARAEEAANEVEAAARSALVSVDKARTATARAREAAGQAAEAAGLVLDEAKVGKEKANHDVEVTEQAESDAADAYHKGAGEARGRARDEGN